MIVYLAQVPTPLVNPTSFAPARFTNVASLLNLIGPLLTLGAALLFGVAFLYAAFLFLTSAGDSEKIGQAKQTISWAVLGLVVVITAYLVVKIIGIILNVPIPI